MSETMRKQLEAHAIPLRFYIICSNSACGEKTWSISKIAVATEAFGNGWEVGKTGAICPACLKAMKGGEER